MNDRAPRSARAGFVRQTLTILLIIAAVELIIMAAFSLLPAMPVVLEAVLDALILSALAAPPIWYLVIRPLRNEVRNRELEVEYHEEELRAQVTARHMDGQILRALDMAEDESGALSAAERTLRLAFEGNRSEILLADSSMANLRVAATSPRDEGPGCSVTTPAGCPAVRRGHPLTFSSSEDIDACPKLSGRAEGAVSAVCVPVNVLGSAAGVLHATGPDQHPPSRDSIEQLRTLGDALGARLSMLRALSDSQLPSKLDPLTWMLNRRSFQDEVGRITGTGTAYAVVALDLDHFKRINDTHGHATGDQALRVFAGTVQKTVRNTDIVARLGGEEFAVVLPSADATVGARLAERIREELAATVTGGSVPTFTVSAGVADSSQGHDLDTVLETADQALFMAKDAGRDRVHIAGVTVEPAGGGIPDQPSPRVSETHLEQHSRR